MAKQENPMEVPLRTQVAWSTELSPGKCPLCGKPTVLVSACMEWRVDSEQAIEAVGEKEYEARFCDGVEIYDEVTGHYCDHCDRLTSLCLNTR